MDTLGSHVFCVLKAADVTGSSEKGFGGDTATVDACATDVMSFNNSDLHALLRRVKEINYRLERIGYFKEIFYILNGGEILGWR